MFKSIPGAELQPCTQPFPACVCESPTTSLLCKQDGREGINTTRLPMVPAAVPVRELRACGWFPGGCGTPAPRARRGGAQKAVVAGRRACRSVAEATSGCCVRSPTAISPFATTSDNYLSSTVLPYRPLHAQRLCRDPWLFIQLLSESKFKQTGRICCCSPSPEEAVRSSSWSSARAAAHGCVLRGCRAEEGQGQGLPSWPLPGCMMVMGDGSRVTEDRVLAGYYFSMPRIPGGCQTNSLRTKPSMSIT